MTTPSASKSDESYQPGQTEPSKKMTTPSASESERGLKPNQTEPTKGMTNPSVSRLKRGLYPDQRETSTRMKTPSAPSSKSDRGLKSGQTENDRDALGLMREYTTKSPSESKVSQIHFSSEVLKGRVDALKAWTEWKRNPNLSVTEQPSDISSSFGRDPRDEERPRFSAPSSASRKREMQAPYQENVQKLRKIERTTAMNQQVERAWATTTTSMVEYSTSSEHEVPSSSSTHSSSNSYGGYQPYNYIYREQQPPPAGSQQQHANMHRKEVQQKQEQKAEQRIQSSHFPWKPRQYTRIRLPSPRTHPAAQPSGLLK
eukprot:jgi/Bigna1/78557/fgenesh1_pg.55_\